MSSIVAFSDSHIQTLNSHRCWMVCGSRFIVHIRKLYQIDHGFVLCGFHDVSVDGGGGYESASVSRTGDSVDGVGDGLGHQDLAVGGGMLRMEVRV